MTRSRMNNRRVQLLGGVGMAIIASSPALAGTTTVTQNVSNTQGDVAGVADAFETIYSSPYNSGAVTASVTGATGGVSRVDSWNGSTLSSTNVLTANTVAAKATGNTFTNTAPLSVLDSEEGTDGLTSLSLAVNTGFVTSSVSNTALQVSLINTPLDSASNSGNSVSAATTINAGTTTLTGAVPSTYSSGTAGHASFDALAASDVENSGSGQILDASASVLASTVQYAVGATPSTAQTSSTNVGLDLLADNGGAGSNVMTTSGAGSLAGNSVKSSYVGNAATSTIAVVGGANPAFDGSAVVDTAQINEGNSGGNQAVTSDTIVRAAVDTASGGVNRLTGSLTVADNAVSAAATGNESLGNSLTLSAVNLSGASEGAGSTIDDRAGSANYSADGALVMSSLQYNDGFGQNEGALVSASTLDTSVTGYVQEIESGSLSVSGNSIAAAARGNNVSSLLGTSGTVNSVSGPITSSSYQLNDATGISATVADAAIAATAGDDEAGAVYNSSLTLSANSTSATAYGNQAEQAVVLDATSINPDTFSGTLLTNDLEGVTTASGLTTLANVQGNYASPVSATTTNSTIRLASDSESPTSGSALVAEGNRQGSVAAGNIATSSVHAAAITLGSGAGLVSMQTVDEASPVTASLEASASAQTQDDIGSGSTISLANNLQRAVAYGSSANNALDAAATTTTGASFGPLFSSLLTTGDFEAGNQVTSSLGLLNTQITLANVSATAAPVEGDASFAVRIGNDVETSTLANEGNTLLAAAYGASASNAAKVAVGNVDALIGPFTSSLANVSSAQYLEQAATVSAQAAPAGTASVLTDINDEVWQSSVLTNRNTVQAQAQGNSTANSLAASGTTVFVPGIFSGAGAAEGGVVELAALGVNSLQLTGEGTVSQATLRDSFKTGTTSASVLTAIDSEVSGSSVVSLDNSLLASAGANSASNVLTADINALSGSAAVNNVQGSLGTVSATMGVAGTPAVQGIDSNYAGSGSSQAGTAPGFASAYSFVNQTLTVADNEVVTLNRGNMSQVEWDALVSHMTASGWVLNSASTLRTNGNGAYDVSFFDGFSFASGNASGAGSVSYEGFQVAGSPAVPNQGGVTIALGSDVDGSTVSVAGNLGATRAVGNEAANSLTIASNSVGQVFGPSLAQVDAGTTQADFAVNNAQFAVGSVTSDNFGTFAVAQDSEASVYGSTLSVADNTQSAKSIANLASNSLAVSATDLANDPVSTGLGSNQQAMQVTSATSNAMFSVPAESTNSSVAISGNSNVALAVQNDVTNKLNVSGTNVGSSLGTTATAAATGEELVTGNVVLGSTQSAQGEALANAASSMTNQDAVDVATAGVLKGSVAFTANVTSAEAAANRASNTAVLNGTSGQGASVGLANSQQSTSTVAAAATSTTTLALTGSDAVLDLAPFQASSGQVSGNTTQALARGNTATNSLTSAAGAGYGAVGSSILPAAAGGTVDASAAVLNDQVNNGAVSAQAANVTYSVVLNSGAGAAGVNASSVAVAGNTASAAAYGNQATNSLTLSALNSGLTTGAVYSAQQNSGAVSAVATSVSYGINSGAGVTNASTFGVSGNAVSAAAVGNSAVSSIIGH